MAKKRYVQVGLGVRARFFYEAIASTYSETSEITGLCDINRTRMEYAARVIKERFNCAEPKLYGVDEFEKMIEEQKPDCVIVTSIDRTHHKYIIKAMEMGCDVITEKPMTIDEKKCQEILDAVERTGKQLRVSFNYRYGVTHTKVCELLRSGVIGDVKAVHFEWMLDTKHGADYFRRWHRDKRNSGGLLVHKSTHHFDLVNFWLSSYPVEVYAMGNLAFYGRENAEERGVTKFYHRAHDSKNAEGDPFALVMDGYYELLENLYLKAEKEDGYIRDLSVFGDGINIEDVMGVTVRYANGTIMTYQLTAFSPKEGHRVVFTGTKGRMEVESTERTYVSGGGDKANEGAVKKASIKVFPMFDAPYEIEVPKPVGGHGGGDPALLNDIFGEPEYDPLHRAASHIDGAMSILTGIAGNKSLATGLPVKIKDLIDIPTINKIIR